MGNFKVGDKVVPKSKSVGTPLEKSVELEKASEKNQKFLYVNSFEEGRVLCHSKEVDYQSGDYFLKEDLTLYKTKPSKKQRIETLEKEVSELKLIVHELRERKPSVFATLEGQDLEAEYAEQVKGEPSTDISVEDKRLTIGDLAKVVVKLTNHRANVGEIVRIVRDAEDRQPYYCERATDGTNLGWFKEEELERVDVIEFEGQQYRKVERLAVVGDVVILKEPAEETGYVKNNTPYKVVQGHNGKPYLIDSTAACLYESYFGRNNETVDVYEPINQPVQRQTVPCSAARPPIEEVGEAFFEAASEVLNPKTANQLRAEVIEKAKGFVEENLALNHPDVETDSGPGVWLVREQGIDVTDEIIFKVNTEKRTVVALDYDIDAKKVVAKGIAKCNPSDVFNEHIGKAIALGRALGLDVSEFEQAVQPSEVVVGMIVEMDGFTKPYISTIQKVQTNQHTNSIGWVKENLKYVRKIINDTNAIYGGVE